MKTTPIEELIIAAHLRALSIMFEGEASNDNRIAMQACVGFDPDIVGERCRLIDAADADAIFAIFDPEDIERGPAVVGVCTRDGDMVRLDTGPVWMGLDGRAALVAPGSHLKVENGRFARCPGKPTADLVRGKARARRRLAQLVSVRGGEGAFMVSMG